MRSTAAVEVFEVHYDSLDRVRIAGWYCLPRKRPDPLPALVFYPGYISEPTLPKNYAQKGYAAFGVAPRGKLRSNGQVHPGYPGLLAHNIIDHNIYWYHKLDKQLYDKHHVLKTKVHDAEIGTLPLDDLTLGTLKKEKLLAKDKMAAMIEEYRKVKH